MTADKEIPLYLIAYKPPENQNFIAIYGDIDIETGQRVEVAIYENGGE